jgi:hypothetical protein
MSVNPLAMRQVLGRKGWLPPEPFGPDGWSLVRRDRTGSVIVSSAEFDGATWIHASIAGQEMPTYEDLVQLHAAVFGDGYAYQVFVPPSQHVNIHEHALHLWGRADGRPVTPEFGVWGTI